MNAQVIKVDETLSLYGVVPPQATPPLRSTSNQRAAFKQGRKFYELAPQGTLSPLAAVCVCVYVAGQCVERVTAAQWRCAEDTPHQTGRK